jgi:hypothetical protein
VAPGIHCLSKLTGKPDSTWQQRQTRVAARLEALNRGNRIDRFPAIRIREIVSTSREILAGDTGLQAAAMEPIHPSPI